MDYSAAVRLDPNNAVAQMQLGMTYLDLKLAAKAIEPLDKAIEELTASKERGDKDLLASAYRARGIAHAGSVDAESGGTEEIAAKCRAAVADLSEAARLYDWRDLESLASVYETRMGCYAALGEKENVNAEKNVVEEIQKAIKTPDDAEPLNNLAFYLATSMNPDMLDIEKALAFSNRACELADWKNPYFLDTLATVYAEAGRFEDAAHWEAKAVELLPKDDEEAKETEKKYRERLERFQSGRK
jgi:tetratricopeptide (TPR) repeat protein